MNNEQKLLTLTLPYIELKKGQNPYGIESYVKDGTFFVKCSDGSFLIVEVETGNGVFGNPLTPNVGNLFTEQILENRLQKRIEETNERMSCMHNELKEYIRIISNNINCEVREEYDCLTERIQNAQSDFGQMLDDIRNNLHSDKNDSNKGFISEDALVQLVKEIKK